jgi:hypothetical protein
MKDEFKNKKVGELRKLKVSLPDLGIDKSLFESISKSFKVYEEQLKKVAESLQKTLEIIKLRNPVFIEEDWYLSEEVWLKFSLSEIYSITPNQLEKLLEKEFNIDSGTIKERIISKHPERNSIVEEIFKSYKRKHFYSVVILSYSFIDGISKKKFGINFWGYDKKLKETKSETISSLVTQDSLFNLIQKRLKNRGQMNLQDLDIPKENIPYSNNRHFVVHGESYLYGNKINALKSILMIDFVSSLKTKES